MVLIYTSTKQNPGFELVPLPTLRTPVQCIWTHVLMMLQTMHRYKCSYKKHTRHLTHSFSCCKKALKMIL
ncbi:unnamed protein product [Arctogadus glacialis]